MSPVRCCSDGVAVDAADQGDVAGGDTIGKPAAEPFCAPLLLPLAALAWPAAGWNPRRYGRFVVTRSDFIYPCPHPPLSILDCGWIWIPDGEQYGGFTDRHLVVSQEEDAAAVLSLIDDIRLRPDELYEEMKHRSDWNP